MDYKKKVKYIKKKSKRWSFQYGKHKRLNIVLGFWINKHNGDYNKLEFKHHFWFDFDVKIFGKWFGFDMDKTLGEKASIRKSYKMGYNK